VSEPEVRVVDPRRGGTGPTLRAYVELTKPRIIELLLTTTIPPMIVAANGWPGWWLVIATLVGGTLSAAGENVINQVIDRDIDGVMGRTRGRPIPTGRVGGTAALVFGMTLGLVGFLWLWATTNLLAASLATVGLLIYVLGYSLFLKRSTTQNIVLGGAAGAIPTLVGWAAVTGSVALPAWIMFAIVFFWTPPHFWALALRYEEDYASAGVPMLPVVVGRQMTVGHMAVYSIVTVGVSFLLYPAVPMAWIYLTAAVLLGGWLVVGALRLRRDAGLAMKYFGVTNVYLAGIFLAIALDVLFL
jgi:protoheme IX farnesyltransferase